MDINFDCPRCGRNLSVDERGAGMTVNCPICKEEIRIPQNPSQGPPTAFLPRPAFRPGARTARDKQPESMPPSPQTPIVSDTFGLAILGTLFLGAILIWQSAKLGISSRAISVLTVIVTAVLALADAKRRQIGGYIGVMIVLLWLVGLPVYLYRRRLHGAPNLLLPGILLIMLFIVARPPTTVINGSVFIVTTGKENIKLGLVQVEAIRERAVLQHLKRLKAMDFIAQREKEVQKEIIDNPPWGATAARNRELRQELERIQASRRYGDAAKKLIFDGLPAPLATATTDADGRFTMRVPANTRIVLAAHSSRQIWSYKTEEYYWLCRISALSNERPILLSNQDLLSDDQVEQVLAGILPTQ